MAEATIHTPSQSLTLSHQHTQDTHTRKNKTRDNEWVGFDKRVILLLTQTVPLTGEDSHTDTVQHSEEKYTHTHSGTLS